MKFGKITIVGAGRVGTSAAFSLICQNIARDVSLLDVDEDILEAQCLDLRDSKYFSFTGHVHKGNWNEVKDSQIIVICAGEVLRPESSLHEVVNNNKRVLDDIFRKLGNLNPKTIVIVATSPVDPMTQYAQKLCGLPKNQVLGTGTLLDTQRLRVKLGKKLGINEKSVHAYVMGEKGDTAFVPWSHSSIAGRKLTEFFAEDNQTQSRLLDTFLEKIKAKTDKMLQSKYGTNFGIAACIAAICKDIIYDTNSVFPLSCFVEEYGCYMSVLCTLGEQGITKIIPLDVTENEKLCFQRCADAIWCSLKYLGFNREGYGAIGETKEGLGTTRKGLGKNLEECLPSVPGGGLVTEISITGTSLDLGKGPEIGGGLGTDIGGFGKTRFEPEGFKELDIGTKPAEKSVTEESFGGGPGIGTIGKDIDEGKQKDTGLDQFGGEKKRLVTDNVLPEESLGRPIRQ